MVVIMLGIVGTSAEPITGPFLKLICPCQSNITFKMIIHAILCRFHEFVTLFHCGHGGQNAKLTAYWCQANHRPMS